MKILLIGGSGCLGTELKKLNSEIFAPSRDQFNINNYNHVVSVIKEFAPDIVIHAAAETDNRSVEKSPILAINTNIIGTANVALACYENNVRLVYISTDYIYKGDKGNYKETNEILPFNIYSWTKLGGECSVVAVKNHLIIRTSFGKNTFDYSEAFSDKWSSKDYVDKIAPLIYEAAISPVTGVLNIGTERKSLYAHATERNTGVKPVKIADTNYFTPYDTSLNLQKWYNYKSDKSIARPHTNCRVCGSSKLKKYLDLGLMPLANNLEFTSQRAKEKERFPLQVMFCEECSLSQLSLVIDPGKMFSYYTYRSSVNAGYVKHCREMAIQLKKELGLAPGAFMIDIAGNDGTLLNQFREEIGLRVLNIDPATNLVSIAEAMGIESVADFLSPAVADSVVKTHGQADLITATNVFAHVDSMKDFVLSAKKLLKPNGCLVIECPYLIDFIEGIEFDTTYFEHLSYVSIIPVVRLCEITGLKVVAVEKQNIHGGTVRITIMHDTPHIVVNDSVAEFVDNEIRQGYDKVEKYTEWATSVSSLVADFSNQVFELKKQGKKVAAFAASAKGNTLLNACNMNTDIISFIADETPEKIGKFSPGNGIPIVNKQEIIKSPPDYIIILSWNFKEAIIEKLRKIYTGKFIIPIPKFTVIE